MAKAQVQLSRMILHLVVISCELVNQLVRLLAFSYKIDGEEDRGPIISTGVVNGFIMITQASMLVIIWGLFSSKREVVEPTRETALSMRSDANEDSFALENALAKSMGSSMIDEIESDYKAFFPEPAFPLRE